MKINEWAKEDRPREKLERLGAESLTNAELLAILIGSGSPKETAVELMRRILGDCSNNLNTLGKMSIHELMEYNGIGSAKAITILAACELGKRRQLASVEERVKLNAASNIYELMHPVMQDLDVEEGWLLLMNQSFKLIKRIRLSHGGLTETAIDVRLIVKEALLNNATCIAVCHNHPSNNPTPSSQDDALTNKIANACKLMRLYFVDHVVMTDGMYYSYREMGRI